MPVKKRLQLYHSLTASMLILAVTLLSCTTHAEGDSRAGQNEVYDLEHVEVYYEEGRYAGWPANNHMWVWEDELLVGFVDANFHDTEGFHTYDPRTARHKYARSLNGGLNWSIADAFDSGQVARANDHSLSDDEAEDPTDLEESIDFSHPDFVITFTRTNNHDGPSHFYYSYDRGNSWEGPYRVPNFGTAGVATRTDYFVDGENELTAFFTIAKSNSREGRVAMVRTTDGGLNWEKVSWIGPEPEGFDIMPSSVRLSSDRILTTIRTRTGDRHDLMTAYVSDDNGESWQQLRDPIADTGRGGSPPALLQLEDGRLALGYAYRSEHGSRMAVRFSTDDGETWSDEITLRGGDGANRDIGYPTMVQRADGKLVLVYYWNNALQEGAPPYRYIAATIFDPDIWL